MSDSQQLEQKYDNGGPYNRMGLNFQDAVAILIAILNYEKEGFTLYLETSDDLEVFVKDLNVFIQVKNSNLSINKITELDEQSNSIILKNISKNSAKHSKYKIVSKNFAKTDYKHLVEKKGELFEDIYVYSDEKKQELIEKLEKCYNNSDLQEKIDNSCICIPPLAGKLEDKIRYLLGLLNDKNIEISKGKGLSLISTILKDIKIKSERLIFKEEDKEQKKLDARYFKVLFKSCDCYVERQDVIDELAKRELITFDEKYLIKKRLWELETQYRAEFAKIQQQLINENAENMIDQIIKFHSEILKERQDIKSELLYAILIEIFILKKEEYLNDY